MNENIIPPPKIPPVLILSTGRCGSTMVSEMLNLHPRVLSLSEFFVPLGTPAFAWQQPDGERMWKTYSRQSTPLHSMLKDGHVVSEGLYPYDQPGSRFQAANMPPIITVTLPHLTDEHEALFDELQPVIRAQPRMPLGDHYRFLFAYLAQKFKRDVWVERSGGSLMMAAKLMRLFPEARIIHVYRDGRETAMSMTQHHNFKVLLGAIMKCRRFGVDPSKEFLSPTGKPSQVWLENVVFTFLDSKKLAEPGPTLTDMGRFWSELILLSKEVLGDLPSDKLLNVKFEDIQQAPREELRRLIRFIDPSLEEESWLDQASAMLRPTRSKFSSLPLPEQKALTEACAPGLDLLGYPL